MKKLLDSFLHFMERDFKLSKHHLYALVLLLLIVGFGLRYGYSLMRERQPRDAKFYIQAVENINSNDPAWFSKYDYYSPLMPLMAASLYDFGIDAKNALIMLNIAYTMLWVLVMFFLCRDVFDDDKAGLLGMSFAVFNPYSIRMASQILREPLYILIFTLCLWLAVKVVKSKGANLLYPVIIGLLTMLAIYTRFEGFEVILFLPLAAIIILMQYKAKYFRQVVSNCVIYFLTLLIIIGTLFYAGDSYMGKVPGKIYGVYVVSKQ